MATLFWILILLLVVQWIWGMMHVTNIDALLQTLTRLASKKHAFSASRGLLGVAQLHRGVGERHNESSRAPLLAGLVTVTWRRAGTFRAGCTNVLSSLSHLRNKTRTQAVRMYAHRLVTCVTKRVRLVLVLIHCPSKNWLIYAYIYIYNTIFRMEIRIYVTKTPVQKPLSYECVRNAIGVNL